MNIDLVGVPIDYGSGRRGVDMGPSAIRYAGLSASIQGLGHSVIDLGNVSVPVCETCDPCEENLRYLECILPICHELADRVASSVAGGGLPVVLGGDHSLALGSISGAARNRRLGVIWIDAHGDFNTHETTPSGNIHGMPLAALAGLGDARLTQRGLGTVISPAHIAVVGARDLDPGERALLASAGVAVFSMDHIDRDGLYQVFRRALETVSRGTDGIYLSLDLDALDPLYAPGVGTLVPGGLTYREAHLACEMVAESNMLVGMDVVEVNPILDERNRTAALAVELILSALGKRVLP